MPPGGRRGREQADEAGGPFSQIFAREAVAVSYARRAMWHEAIEAADEAPAIIRSRRVGPASRPLLLGGRRLAVEIGADGRAAEIEAQLDSGRPSPSFGP